MLIAPGDLRDSANLAAWPAQLLHEEAAARAFKDLGWTITRADTCAPHLRHGLIASQAQGRDVFAKIHPEAPLVVAVSTWQYSHHTLIGLARHTGPILILANFSGRFPGLVGALNLRASLVKAGVRPSMLWTEDFKGADFRRKLKRWLDTGRVRHDTSHVAEYVHERTPRRQRRLGEGIANDIRAHPPILGVFDEGCMGMENAIIPDHLLRRVPAFKERLSQSALYAEMGRVPDAEADDARAWLNARGMKFVTGTDHASTLTDAQIRGQLKMYIAAARMAERFGCDAIGIQYQQGLADLAPASDLAEGLLNCSERPAVLAQDGLPIRDGRPILHFNEVDECAGLDAVITERACEAMGIAPDNTLHDLRWCDADESGTVEGDVWVLEISGAVPPSHLEGGYAGATSMRQPAVFFRAGGGTIKGMSRPGEVVWSRIFVEGERLHMDIGRLSAVTLPPAEMERRWDSTTREWPIMNAVIHGVTRDQMMARHMANHIQVVYASAPGTANRAQDAEAADRLLAVKCAAAHTLGIKVHLCGTTADREPLAEYLARHP